MGPVSGRVGWGRPQSRFGRGGGLERSPHDAMIDPGAMTAHAIGSAPIQIGP